MKDRWMQKYRDQQERDESPGDVLTGFNANIDSIIHTDKMDLSNVDAHSHDKIIDVRQAKSEVLDAIQHCENRELPLKNDIDFRGEKRIGGQAGIAANFLSQNESGVVFYTPFLSEELAEMMNEKVLFPVNEGRFVLKNVKDASNTDRTKRNVIVEFDSDCTGRVIFSREMRGFGPYFRKGVEDEFENLEKEMDCAFLGGFHDVDGNVEAKLTKSKKQLNKLDLPIHVEYVHNPDVADQFIEKIFAVSSSVGLDEEEALKIAEILNIDTEDQLRLGGAFQLAKKLIERGTERVHIHTIRYHVVIDEGESDQERTIETMLQGELAALAAAEYGEIPSKEQIQKMEFEDIHLHKLDELEHFQHFFDLENFVETGKTEMEGLNVTSIPTLIHEDPARLVGLGDVISCSAWAHKHSS